MVVESDHYRYHLTWGEFKAAVEQLGVRDEDKLAFIDWYGNREPSWQFFQRRGPPWAITGRGGRYPQDAPGPGTGSAGTGLPT